MRGLIKSDQPSHIKAKILTQKAYKYAISAYEVVCIFFYAEWCTGYDSNRPSWNYAHEYDKAATIISQLYPKPKGKKGKAIMLKVNCNDERNLSNYFNIWCFPSYRIVKNGQYVENVDFHFERTTEKFLQFIEQFIDDKIERNPKCLQQNTFLKTILLPEKGFMDMINSCDYSLIMFYTDWGQETESALKFYENAANKLEKYLQQEGKSSVKGAEDSIGTIRLFRLNCTYDNKFATSLNIRRYPAFKLFKNGEDFIEYRWNKNYTDQTIEGLIELIKNISEQKNTCVL